MRKTKMHIPRCLEIPEGDEPFYAADFAANVVGITTQTLKAYIKHGLVYPVNKGGIVTYSSSDIIWLRCLRELVHVNKISIAAVKKLLEYAPCWEIKNCACAPLTPTRGLPQVISRAASETAVSA